MLKYIILDDMNETPILFPLWIEHERMASKFSPNPLSAGFVEITEGKVIVSPRKSVSLKLGPRPQDTALIEAAIKFQV